MQTGGRGQNSTLCPCQARLRVRVVAVCADRGVCIASGQCPLVNTIQGLFVLLGMTLLAGCVKFKGKVARTTGCYQWMREVTDIRVTVHAGDILLAMH